MIYEQRQGCQISDALILAVAKSLVLVGRASSSNTAGNLARLALSKRVCSAIVDICPSSALAGGEEGGSGGGSLIASERVDASILAFVVLCFKLITDQCINTN
jgi:hypothetical protein